MGKSYKIRVSEFVDDILGNDAQRFGFYKNEKPNKSGLINKLLPTIVAIKKEKRNIVEDILVNDFNRNESNSILDIVNMVMDRVQFSDVELGCLSMNLCFRAVADNERLFNEIITSECMITAQEPTVYIRNLLNEYCLLPQFKREMVVFDKELETFDKAHQSHRIVHFTDKVTNKKYRAFPIIYLFDYLVLQQNYFVFYDITNKRIFTEPVWNVKDMYAIRQQFKPSEQLQYLFQEYTNQKDFDNVVQVEDIHNVL